MKNKIPQWIWILIGILVFIVGILLLYVITDKEYNSNAEINPLIIDLCESKRTLCDSQVEVYGEHRNCNDEYEYCLIK